MSVIVPAYNAGRHIAEALRSVERQTYSDWEVIVCDDGSADETATIAAAFTRARTVWHAQNQGLASARNTAIESATGELVALLDADDYWLERYLEHQVALYDEHVARAERVGIVSANAHLLEPTGLAAETYGERFGFAEDVSVATLLERNPIFISVLMPAAALEEVGKFATDLRSAEDLDLWLRMLEAGYTVVSTRTPLVVYRISPGQLSAQPASMARARQEVYRRALERGSIGGHERRLARRSLRLERAVAAVTGSRCLSLGDLPLLGLVAIESPQRWRGWASAAWGALARAVTRRWRGALAGR